MIIGINGDIGSGKDTLGMILQALTMQHGAKYREAPLLYIKNYEDKPNCKGGWRIVKFADKLRDMVALTLNIDREFVNTREFKDFKLGSKWGDRTGRQMLQDMGEKMRELEPDFWVNALFTQYRPQGMQVACTKFQTYPDWIITDMRHKNEFKAVKDRGGITVKIVRPNNPFEQKAHTSEGNLSDHNFDVHVLNTSLGSLVEWAEIILATTREIEC